MGTECKIFYGDSQFTIIGSSPEFCPHVWYKQHPRQFCRRYCRWDCGNCTLVKAKIPSNRYIYLCCILSRDDNGSINRIYINEINKHLCFKSKLIKSISLVTLNGLYKVDLLNQICSMPINYILSKKGTPN